MKQLNMQQKMFSLSVIGSLFLVLAITIGSSMIPGRFAHHGFEKAIPATAQAKTKASDKRELAAKRAELSKPLYHKGKKYVALTFDDGPSRYTRRVLKILRDNDVRATFFVIGTQIHGGRHIIKDAHKQGCQIASHTFRHRYFPNKSQHLLRTDVLRTNSVLKKNTGLVTNYVRLPYGATNKKMNKTLRGMHMRKVFWTIDTRDWSRPGVNTIIRRATRPVKNGSIILMHDGGGNRTQTLKALPEVIKRLKKKGYIFCTVDDLYRFGIKK